MKTKTVYVIRTLPAMNYWLGLGFGEYKRCTKYTSHDKAKSAVLKSIIPFWSTALSLEIVTVYERV